VGSQGKSRDLAYLVGVYTTHVPTAGCGKHQQLKRVVFCALLQWIALCCADGSAAVLGHSMLQSRVNVL
jgi:hypothetical protein